MPEVNLAVNLGGLKMNNPVVAASGTFGYGLEYGPYLDVSRLGAITMKGLTLKPREGNPPPRLAETPAGLLNAIGLMNHGLEYFVKDILPRVRDLGVSIIVNLAGETVEEFSTMSRELEGEEGIAALEINISCPNVRAGGMAFGVDVAATSRVVTAVRCETRRPVIVKLTPNVTDVLPIARAAVEAGADALSMINTILGMAIDIKTRRPVLGNIFGGLSGPAVKPVALRMVYQVSRAVSCPILGMGGIVTAMDALEFIMAGATAVSLGTANFLNPGGAIQVIDGIADYCRENGIADINQLVGAAWGKS